MRTAVLEGRHRRRLAQARHEAAKTVVHFARDHRIGLLVVGDPRGVLDRDAGARQNLATRTWRVGQLIDVLRDKAQRAGIEVITVDERGTSSTCCRCGNKVPKPKGRNFSCRHAISARIATWWVPSTSLRGHLEVESTSTRPGWRSRTVEPVGICPAGPGVTRGGWLWNTVATCWVWGRPWPALWTSKMTDTGSRSLRKLRLPERETGHPCPKWT